MFVEKSKKLEDLLKSRVLILDGAMGTMIQRKKLNENSFRGEKFKDCKINLTGNNDILNLSQGNIIYDIHKSYLQSGADIIETNTFNSSGISQNDYNCSDYSYDLNFQGGLIARRAVDDYLKINPNEIKFVAGVLGPTNRTCSMSPDVNNPGFRNVSFDELLSDYEICVSALTQAKVDIIMVETVFDTLNAKAALMAIKEVEKKNKSKIPIMISATITDLSGRTLSGQTIEGFYNSVIHSNPLSVGLNCALGPKELEPYLIELDRVSDVFVSIHPNAGLPNAFGEYDETPTSMGKFVKEWSDNKYVNIVGGCCGTTPDHIEMMKNSIVDKVPRELRLANKKLRLSGLEPFNF
jgi:5-methyltetrahydrofolate--homocysteine methyltransferase